MEFLQNPRPRLLYSSVFLWFTIAGGRFIAPFLEKEAGFGDNDALIGFTLSMCQGVMAILGPIVANTSDRLERRYPGRGWTTCLFLGITLGSLSLLLHGAKHVFPHVVLFEAVAYHVFLRLLFAIGMAMILPVLDGITLAHLEKEGGDSADYGKERLFGAIFWGIGAVSVGPFLDRFGFSAMYAFTAVLMLLNWSSILLYAKRQQERHSLEATISADETAIEEKHRRSFVKELPLWTLLQIMLGSIAAVTFFFSYFCLSCGLTVVENMVFLFFEQLGASNTLEGLTVAITVMFEIPIFHVAPALLRRFGSSTMLQIANLAYIVRVLGYTIVPAGQPWLILLFEPLHGVIYGCSQAGGVEFVNGLMPVGYEASGQSLMQMFRGFGGIVGLSAGGWLQQVKGPHFMYRSFALLVFTGGLVFGIARCLHPEQRRRRTVSISGDLESVPMDDVAPLLPTTGESSTYGSTNLMAV